MDCCEPYIVEKNEEKPESEEVAVSRPLSALISEYLLSLLSNDGCD